MIFSLWLDVLMVQSIVSIFYALLHNADSLPEEISVVTGQPEWKNIFLNHGSQICIINTSSFQC